MIAHFGDGRRVRNRCGTVVSAVLSAAILLQRPVIFRPANCIAVRITVALICENALMVPAINIVLAHRSRVAKLIGQHPR